MYYAEVGYCGCCGFREICNFADDEDDLYPGDNSTEIRAETPEELLTEAQAHLRSGTLLSIWFKRDRKWDGTHEPEYHWGEVRQLVQQIPGVVHMGEHFNPNSGNMIDGYFWKVSK